MKIISQSVLAGPNIHSPRPVLTLVLDAGVLGEWTVSRLSEAHREELKRLLPDLPAEALSPDTRVTTLFAEVISALQMTTGSLRPPATARALATPNHYLVVAEYETSLVGLLAAQVAVPLVIWLVPASTTIDQAVQANLNPTSTLDRLREKAAGYSLDQTTAALVREAVRRGIPWYRPSDFDRLVQFGQGSRRTRIRETVTDRTGSLAASVAHSKSRTNQMLGNLVLPRTRQAIVSTEAEAVLAAERLGYPVVVKPGDRGKAIGVSVGLKDRAAVVTAFHTARRFSSNILVEGMVPGEDHRLLVIDGKMVAASKRVSARVVGDGRRTVSQLVEELNRDPRRGRGFTNLLVTIEFDDDTNRMLAEAGLTPKSVPDAGQIVILRSASSISAGGTPVDVTADVHPDNRIAAERAARVSGLDITGVDFITPDIRSSWREVGGAILEINQSPGLRAHWGAEGSDRVTGLVMDSLVPPGTNTRIPIAAITGTNGKTTTSLLTGHILSLDGRTVGTATTIGVRVGSDTVARGDFAGSSGARMLLQDPLVDAAVIESARRGLLQHGLCCDWCDVGAVLNVGSDHVGTDGIGSLEEMAAIKRLAVAHAKRMAVLNADDPLCVGMADDLIAERICFISGDASSPLVKAHVEGGGPAVWFEESRGRGAIIIHDGQTRHELSAVSEIPIAMNGTARHNIQNAMFAAAIAFGLGESLETIRKGLFSFVSTPETNPGRFNLYDRLPFRVMVEFAHNAEAVDAVAEFAQRLDVKGRRIAVLWSHGNRIEGHYAAVACAAAKGFDRFICTEPKDPRGRPPGDISARLGAGLRGAGMASDRISIEPNEDRAIQLALESARPGDFVFICCKEHERAWQQITSFHPEQSAEANRGQAR